ncbi:MAG: bifunctional phosphopantothenoylcysteine decarboxylase/phosphopantothenate--cysteine ligase CoaBC [Proteobacteria bacterium]|nr:bifunctional phosphopantothenoylcysteine decarboxylase/phosphopantothenate--cysteine ligase CoaBC [Pseudomonadota bacterium]
MTTTVAGKKILFGLCGSIAAYKSAGWVRELSKAEAQVTVIMTDAASRFVSSLTLSALSGQRVYTHMFEADAGEEMSHISLAADCDLIVVSPASAHTIARLAHGMADDLLSTVILAATARVLIFPAMNSKMYCHPATQANCAKLREYGYQVIEPGEGLLACGDEGIGKLVDWQVGRETILSALTQQDLSNKSVLITAGPTWESLDPVRHLSNRSTGRMGYALARTARRRGAEVTLVSGPTSLEPPPGIEVIRVESAAQMYEAVMDRYEQADIVVKSAAVSDYRPAKHLQQKIKKSAEKITMQMVPNPDILLEMGKRKKRKKKPLLVGFAAESRNHLAEGKRKLKNKNLDMIVINDIKGCQTGFGSDTNQITLVDKSGQTEKLPLLSKEECADIIWDRSLSLLG